MTLSTSPLRGLENPFLERVLRNSAPLPAYEAMRSNFDLLYHCALTHDLQLSEGGRETSHRVCCEGPSEQTRSDYAASVERPLRFRFSNLANQSSSSNNEKLASFVE